MQNKNPHPNAKPKKEREKLSVASNRRANAKYEILETIEAGVMLTGPEVKSLRGGGCNLQDGFARVEDERARLYNVHISPYNQGSLHVVQEPTRTRTLLLHHREIMKLQGKTVLKGLTIVPLEIYFNKRGKAKVLLALARGKNAPDRREDIKKRTINREMQREFAGRTKNK
jgi:SsrA-binding protein